MEQIIEATYNLIASIDESIIMKQLLTSKDQIYNNVKLMNELKIYHGLTDQNEILMRKIALQKHPMINQYLKSENELNYIILDINKRLSTLLDHKRCH